MSTISSSTTSSTAYKVAADTTGTLVLQTGATPTTAVTIDGSQNVLVGGTTQYGGAKITISNGGAYLALNSTSGGYSLIRGFDSGTERWSVGQIGFGGTDGMAFYTGASNTERARIDSSGNFTVGATSGSWGSASGNQVSPSFQQINKYNGVNGDQFIAFSRNSTTIGSISQSGTTAVLFNVTSDQRLKENIVDAPEFGGLIDSIKVRSYDWKADGNHQRAGFIAQELVTVAPEAVHQPLNKEDMMAVDYSKLVPMLVKEIQSLRKRLAALESA